MRQKIDKISQVNFNKLFLENTKTKCQGISVPCTVQSQNNKIFIAVDRDLNTTNITVFMEGYFLQKYKTISKSYI